MKIPTNKRLAFTSFFHMVILYKLWGIFLLLNIILTILYSNQNNFGTLIKHNQTCQFQKLYLLQYCCYLYQMQINSQVSILYMLLSFVIYELFYLDPRRLASTYVYIYTKTYIYIYTYTRVFNINAFLEHIIMLVRIKIKAVVLLDMDQKHMDILLKHVQKHVKDINYLDYKIMDIVNVIMI